MLVVAPQCCMDSINLKKFIFREGDNFEATGQQREVHIKFYCNHKKPLGEPHFTNQLGNKYFFDFQTSLVCPASAVECFVRKGNLTYDLTPLGLIAGKKSTAKSVRDRRRLKKMSYFIDAWVCFLVAAILNFAGSWCEVWNREIAGDRQSDIPKILGRSHRLLTRAAPKISCFQKTH